MSIPSLSIRILGFLTFVALHADAQEPHTRLPSDNLLVFRNEGGGVSEVETASDWKKRRDEIVRSMQLVMGPLPGDEKRCELAMKVESERDCGTYVRQLIPYSSEPGSRVPA